MFSRKEIKPLLEQYTMVQLYTDSLPKKYRGEDATPAEENLELLHKRFKTAQLPLYVILKPLGNGEFKELSRYEEGKINDVPGFASFLERPLNLDGARVAARE